MPHRVFQGAGSLLLRDESRVMRRNQRKVRQLFLFNDLLLVTKHRLSENKYHLKVVVFLANVNLEHSPATPLVTGNIPLTRCVSYGDQQKNNNKTEEDAERCFLLRSIKKPEHSLLFEARSTEDKVRFACAFAVSWVELVNIRWRGCIDGVGDRA